MKRSFFYFLIILYLYIPVDLPGFETSGQISANWQTQIGSPDQIAFSLVALPEFHWLKTFPKPNTTWQVNLVSYLLLSRQISSRAKPQNDVHLKPYRLWFSCSGSQWQFRLGLQKINFGSARYLRALRWFDRVDPRDPLQMTEGVYGALGRYFFLNNANIWAWILYGNNKLKGLEQFATANGTQETGMRLQLPVPNGEMGLTLHQRKILERHAPLSSLASEQRLALDGIWDLGIGLWFEATFVHSQLNWSSRKWQKWFTLGGDYTFAVGNGLHSTLESLWAIQSENFTAMDQRSAVSALFFDYPIGVTNQIAFGVFYSWTYRSWFRYFNWQHTLDNWIISLSGFWNPEQTLLFSENQNVIYGKGFQVMVIFNY